MNKYEIQLNGISVNHQAIRKKNGYTLLNDPDQDVDYAVITPKVSLELGAAGSLEFTLPPDHPMYDGYSGDATEEEETEQRRWTMATVTLQEEGDYIFAGRVYSWKIDMFKRKTLCCEGALSFLHDSVQPYAVYDGVHLDSFVNTLLTYHNLQVQDNRKIYTGHLNQLTGPTIYRVTQWETTWDALQKYVLDTNGGYFMIRTVATKKGVYKHYLDYYSQSCILFSSNDYSEGSETGYYQNMYNNQVIEFGENLLDISEEFAMDDVLTQILPLGATILSDQILKELGFTDDQENATVVGFSVTCRKDAGDDYQPVNNYAGLAPGTVVTVDNLKKDIFGEVWYHITYKVKITGFVDASATDKENEWDALGEGSYGSAQVTAVSTPVRTGASSSFPQVADYDSEDANDESTFFQGQTFSVKGVYMDVKGTGKKWFAVEFSEKSPSGYVKSAGIAPTDGYQMSVPIVSGLSLIPIGTARVNKTTAKIRTKPDANSARVSETPVLKYGDTVEVCDIDYPEKGAAWFYVKYKGMYYGFVKSTKLEVTENIVASCPNSRFRRPGSFDMNSQTTIVNTVGVPGFYTDHWAQSLSLTSDNRRTIAAWNDGRIVLTIQDAISFEEWYAEQNGELLNGVPILTGSSAAGADKVHASDLGGFPVDEDSLKMIKQVKKKNSNEETIWFNAGDNNAVQRFGLITKVVEFSDCKTAEELKHKASKYLLEHVRYPVEITCSSADLHYLNLNWAAFKIGQFVPIRFPGWRSEYSWGSSPYFAENGSLLRILNLEISLDTGMKTIKIGTQKRKDLTEITKEIKDEAERDKNKIKVMNVEDYELLPFKDNDKIYFCAGDA